MKGTTNFKRIIATIAALSAATATTTVATTVATAAVPSIGDINGDGRVNAVDASAILSYYADASAGKDHEIDVYIADVNGDSMVNSSDASVILKKYADEASGTSTNVWPAYSISTSPLKKGHIYLYESSNIYTDIEGDKVTLNGNDTLKILDFEGGWYQVQINGQEDSYWLQISDVKNFKSCMPETILATEDRLVFTANSYALYDTEFCEIPTTYLKPESFIEIVEISSLSNVYKVQINNKEKKWLYIDEYNLQNYFEDANKHYFFWD